MRDYTFKAWLLAVSLILPCVAHAAGLGRLTVHSTLGQHLNAEVELLSVQKNETILARLASPEVYQQAGVAYSNALVGTRVTVEKRPSGQPFLKVTTPRPINEPFLEVLIEINSENGRVVRQYTALLDPPGYGRAAGEIPPPKVDTAVETRPPVASAPPASPDTAAKPRPPAPPVATPLPPPAATSPAPPPVAKPKPAAATATGSASAGAGAKQYGPIKPGETLGGIARSVKPEGVTLEQALVGLFRENPDAFIRKNMNLVKSGKILRVPEAERMTALPQPEARQEVRVQVADFNAYRQRVADRAGAAPEGGTVTTGRIATRVSESGAGPKDTVRLSPGESAGKGKGKAAAADRVRALEEEAIAREKALTDAKARIAQLEKIIEDTKRASALKAGGAQKAPEAPAAPPTKAAESAPVAKGPAVAEASKPAAAQPSKPEPAPVAKGQPSKPEPAPVAKAQPSKPEPAAKPQPPAPEPAQVAKAKPAPPPPEPERNLVDTIMEEPLYLAALGGGVVVLGGLGLVAARRRRTPGAKRGSRDDLVKIAPTVSRSGSDAEPAARPSERSAPAADGSAAAAAAAAAGATAPAAGAPADAPSPAPAPPATPVDDNDLDFNLGGPRAPGASSSTAAPPARPATGSAPPPAPSASAEPARAPEPAPHPVAASAAPAGDPTTRAPEPAAPQTPPSTKTPEVSQAAREPAGAPEGKPLEPFEPLKPNLAPGESGFGRKPAADDRHTVDFDLEPLPPVNAPMSMDKVSNEPPPPVDFKLDLADLDINAPEKRGGAVKDDHWYDVQQKFDLAKAYEEMGDKDGARDILEEVLREGDPEQKAQAQKLLGSLS